MDINGNRWHRVGSHIKVRRSGKTQLWKTRPGEFKIPVKYGLYESGYITHDTQEWWHDGEDWHECSLCQDEESAKQTRVYEE